MPILWSSSSGPPGAGKTTIGRILAPDHPWSVCVESDWFWTTIVNGHTPPWEVEADHQNRVMLRSALATAARTCEGGYFSVLDGIVGPWHLDLLREEATSRGLSPGYVVLRPKPSTRVWPVPQRESETSEPQGTRH